MSDLWIEIAEMLNSGCSVDYITETLQVPFEWIQVIAGAEGIEII